MATYQYDPATGSYTWVDDSAASSPIAVATDQVDYAPGTTATFTASNVTVGGTVEFIVAHDNAGADGIVGTADDYFTYDLSGTGTPWFVTDGGEGDLDGIANGTVVTSWNVNLDASNQAFVVSAIDVGTGAAMTTAFTDKPLPEPTDFAYDATHIELAAATGVEINTAGAIWANAGSALNLNLTSSGTGQFGTFVEVQDNGAEQGFNTNANDSLDTKNSNVFNHPLLLSNLQAVDADGNPTDTTGPGTYYVFRLDLHQNVDRYISLDGLQIWQSSNGALSDFTAGPGDPGAEPSFAFNSGASKIYDLNSALNEQGGLPNSVLLNSLFTAGSGGGADLVLLIPTGDFNPANGDFVYLYSAFGYQDGGWQANSTFEEWGALLNENSTQPPTPHASVSLTKDTVCPDDGDTIAGGPVLAGSAIKWTYAVTNTGDVGLNNVVITDDNGTPDDGNPLNGDETLDDFHPTAVTVLFNGNQYNIGDLNHNGILDGDDPTTTGVNEAETWQFTATGTAVAGAYTNIATVTTDATGFNPLNPPADLHPSGFDTSGYFGVNPTIVVDKKTNGVDHGLNLLQGQAITWTYSVKLGADSNVDLTNIVLTDDNGTPDDGNPANGDETADDFHPTAVMGNGSTTADSSHNIGDLDNDGILGAGETWQFVYTGTAGATAYTNTVTVTADTYYNGEALTEDACENSLVATDTDTSDYTGHARAQEGLTKGYWATHATLWDVKIGDEKGSGNEINSFGTNPPGITTDWNKSGSITQSSVVEKGAASTLGLVSGANNGGGDSGLLMGDLNHDGLANDGCDLFFDLASAQALANSSVVGDARIILAGQAVAAQLNEYADYVLYGHDTSPNGLINEAVQWLKGLGPLSNGKSNVDTNLANDVGLPAKTVIQDAAGSDYTLKNGAITLGGTALSSSDASWQQKAQVFSEATAGLDVNGDGDTSDTVWANGEGLKNALAAYNHGLSGGTQGFVTSQDGSLIGWENSVGGTPYDMHPNDPDVFWGILANHNITGVEWH